MIMRAVTPEDIPILQGINKRDYPTSNFPDLSVIQSAAVITEDDGTFITFGGIELIAEAVLITDRQSPLKLRGKALIQILEYLKSECVRLNQSDLHAFINGSDVVWGKALSKYGFKSAGDVFFTKVG